MNASVRVELFKLRHRPAVWVLGAAWVLMGVVFGYVIPYLLYHSGGDVDLAVMLPERVVDNAIQGFPYFGLMLVVVLGVLGTASEYSWATISTILVQRPSRQDLLVGKFGAAAIVIAVFAAALFVADAMFALGVAALENAAVRWPSAVDLISGIGAGWLILYMGAVLGMLLGIILRSTGLAVGAGLVYVAVIEGLIGGFANQSSILHAIATALPGTNASSLAIGFVTAQADTPGVVEVVPPAQGAIVLALYLVVFVVIAAMIFGRRDVTGSAG